MKLPNGFGNVSKLPGNRRNPWRARKTDGWEYTSNGERLKQKFVTIGYYQTRKAAIEALADFNANPYDIKTNTITFAEVYDKWSEDKYPTISTSNVNGYKASYNSCELLYIMKFVDIKLIHLQQVVKDSGKNYPTLRKLKVLFGQLFDYAVIHEIITKDKHIVEYVDIKNSGNPNKMDRKPFSKKEIDKLWHIQSSNEYFSIILILIYSGVRITELLDLKKENIHLDEKWFDVIDSKTEAGIRRVPISDKTLPFFESWMNKNECEYLLSTSDEKHFTYRNYYDSYWTPLIEQINSDHRPHDTRHTCTSLLSSAEVNETTIKMIIGHKGQMSLTERVYTHKTIQELLDAINKI